MGPAPRSSDNGRTPGRLAVLLLALTGLLAIPPAAVAQLYPVDVYDETNGLPSSQIQDIVQHPDGTIWLASRNGVISYDGARWRSYGIPEGLSPPDRREVLVDARGRIWAIGSLHPVRVAVLEDDSWHAVEPFPSTRPNALVTGATLAGDAEELVLTDEAGEILLLRDGEWRPMRLAGTPVHDLVATPAGLLAATGDGLERLRPGRLDTEPWRLPGLPTGEVLTVAHDPLTGSLWIVGPSWIGRATDGRFEILGDGLDLNLYPRYSTGFDAVPGPTGDLYFAYEAGVFHFDPAEGLRSLGLSNGLVGNGATALMKDAEGNIWVTNLRGISKIKSTRFLSYTSRHGLLEREVSATLERRSGEIVLGAPGGLTFLEEDGPRALRFSDDPLRGLVLDLAEEPSGTLWAAANYIGLWSADPDGVRRWHGEEDGLPLPAISLLVDSASQLWVGTGRGLYRRVGSRFEPVELPVAVPNVYARRIHQTPDGRIWVATGGQGVLEIGDGIVLRSGDGAQANNIYALQDGPNGTLWAGTPAGLYEVTPRGLTRVQPSPTGDRPIYLIVADADGGYWFGTDRGVYQWRDGAVRHFDVGDGLVGSEINRGGGTRDRTGRIWFGTNAGVSVYRPEHDLPRPPPPPVELLSLEAGGAPLELHRRVEVAPGRGSLAFRFRAPYFHDESGLRFGARLEGAETTWQPPRPYPDRELRYPHLPPGRYRLHVQALGPDGAVGPITVSPWIDVQAHVWQRGWFRISAALAGALLVAAMVWTASTFRHARELESEVQRRTSDLRASRETIARDRARLAATLRSITDGVVAADAEGRIVLWNPATERITGWSADEALGQPLATRLRLEAEDVGEVLAKAASDTHAGSSCTLLGRDDERRQVEISGTPLDPGDGRVAGAVLALRDVTERRRMERNLARAERLEALGILAGGIAHDFNNLLTAVLGNISLLEASARLSDEDTRCLSDAREGAERAQSLTRQLLTFAKGGAPSTDSVSIAELLRSTSSFVFRGTPIRTQLELADDLRPVEADADQLAQVFENLFLNARQVLSDGGTVTIDAADVDSLPGDEDDPSAGESEVRIEISDDGPGIPPDDLERIFDPYFSTKPDGTGLGLTIVHSIIDRHGGRLGVESTPGSGTTFRIWLPAARGNPKAPREPATSPRSGTGRILVMDDEEAIRGLLARMLERVGYDCATTACGEDALRVYREERAAGRPFDAVILDLTVPDGMGGKEALKHLRQIDPDVRAIVASGYSDDALLADAEAHGFRAAVAKPFDLRRISETLARVLEADERPRGVTT